MPSAMTFRTAFGSWGNALRAAGFEPVKWIPTKNGVTRKGTRNKNRSEIVNDAGYVEVFEPEHPMSMSNGYVLVHRMVAYDAGLLTDPDMDVHHINGDKLDNRLDNLRVMSKSRHTRHHHKGNPKPRKGSTSCMNPECGTLQASKYGLCRKHYKLEWQRRRDGLIEHIGDSYRFEHNLLEKEVA